MWLGIFLNLAFGKFNLLKLKIRLVTFQHFQNLTCLWMAAETCYTSVGLFTTLWYSLLLLGRQTTYCTHKEVCCLLVVPPGEFLINGINLSGRELHLVLCVLFPFEEAFIIGQSRTEHKLHDDCQSCCGFGSF